MRKLIEVALPLEAINRESAREKSIRHGHPSTLHLWWARRPLAACRAIIFASLVDDPSSHPELFPTDEAQDAERQRLFRIIDDLVKWENTTNEAVLGAARAEIMRSCDGHPPALLDPFCGGGSIPLEAQRLGLEANASDLNPVAVLITKALIEIPATFEGRPPVHPEAARLSTGGWTGAEGLAEDVQYYGSWMRDEAEKRIGTFYPKVALPPGHGGGEATVIAWIWARTVKSPNPAWGALMPLVRSFALSTKRGKETWIHPIVDWEDRKIRFEIRLGPGCPVGTVSRNGAICLATGSAVPLSYIRAEGTAGRMGSQLMAMVVETRSGRIYLPASEEQERRANEARPGWKPDFELVGKAAVNVPLYGLRTHADLYTQRQLLALSTFADLIKECRVEIEETALKNHVPVDPRRLADGGKGAAAYADAVVTYLAFGVDKNALTNCTQATWQTNPERLTQAMGRQAIPFTWDYAEANPLSFAGGGYALTSRAMAEVLERLPTSTSSAVVEQLDASVLQTEPRLLVITDPPYYDNISYADLSDFFYVWLRRSLTDVYPVLMSTILVPKFQEIVATPYRHSGDRESADRFFEGSLSRVFARIHLRQHPSFPFVVFYAFKQAESDSNSAAISSTGWETMLEGLLASGFAINGTWPVRTELVGNLKGKMGVLATSIVLICRARDSDAPLATRKEFLAALRSELPKSLRNLQQGSIAPVDLAQAAIGPGIGVFSQFSRVIEADGSAMPIRTALGLVNQVLDETLSEQEGDFDPETRWALAWFEECAFALGPFGKAETLSKAKNTSIKGLAQNGLIESNAGKVRLLSPSELSDVWDASGGSRVTVWEVAQHLSQALDAGGESKAARLLRRIGGLGETARELAYRLYVICERKKWAKEALAYNSLVVAWPEIVRLAGAGVGPTQEGML